MSRRSASTCVHVHRHARECARANEHASEQGSKCCGDLTRTLLNMPWLCVRGCVCVCVRAVHACCVCMLCMRAVHAVRACCAYMLCAYTTHAVDCVLYDGGGIGLLCGVIEHTSQHAAHDHQVHIAHSPPHEPCTGAQMIDRRMDPRMRVRVPHARAHARARTHARTHACTYSLRMYVRTCIPDRTAYIWTRRHAQAPVCATCACVLACIHVSCMHV